MRSWLRQLVRLSDCPSFCVFVPPLRTVSCGQQHHFSWQPRRRLRVTQLLKSPLFRAIVSSSLASLPRCQSANVFQPLSLINGLPLSPSPRLYYRPLCVWTWTLFRWPTGDSPSGCVARHMAPSCHSRLISGGLADIKQR